MNNWHHNKSVIISSAHTNSACVELGVFDFYFFDIDIGATSPALNFIAPPVWILNATIYCSGYFYWGGGIALFPLLLDLMKFRQCCSAKWKEWCDAEWNVELLLIVWDEQEDKEEMCILVIPKKQDRVDAVKLIHFLRNICYVLCIRNLFSKS